MSFCANKLNSFSELHLSRAGCKLLYLFANCTESLFSYLYIIFYFLLFTILNNTVNKNAVTLSQLSKYARNRFSFLTKNINLKALEYLFTFLFHLFLAKQLNFNSKDLPSTKIGVFYFAITIS